VNRLFVGDVQGCADELDELVERARSEFGGDFELWLAGDLVNRGPHSLRVLERVRELMDAGRARAVLGNHDLTLIATHLGVRPLRAKDTFGDVLAHPRADDWIDWLRRLPLVETGAIDGDAYAVVHAAAHPDWTLEKLAARAARVAARLGAPDRGEAAALLRADPDDDPDRDVLARLTSARSVDRDGAHRSDLPARPVDAWHRRWQRRGHDYGVVYGHWAVQRLHVAPGLRGLDTGCVHHGRGSQGALTAWLPDVARRAGSGRPLRAFAVPDDRFWHVPAHRRYYRDAPEDGSSNTQQKSGN
jgi:bis(5'-nucleosyl)-tetraphosphatase (symmetrical)